MAYDQMKLIFAANALVALRKRATLARLAWTDLMARFAAMAHGETIRMNYVGRPTPTATDGAGSQNVDANAANITSIEFKLDKELELDYVVDDRDAQTMTDADMMAIGRTYGDALADSIERYLFELLGGWTRADVGDNGSNVALGATPFSANVDAISAARRRLVQQDVDLNDLAIVLNPEACEGLLKQKDFIAADFRGGPGQETGLSGELGTRLGFRFFESNNINQRRAAGNAAVNGNHNSGDSMVRIDGAGAAGIARGEYLKIGASYYGVVEGTTAADGTVTLNRGLTANVNDNTVVNRREIYGYALQPMSLAFAMRPTAAPERNRTSYADIESVIDRETGFAVTVERYRQNKRTVYQLRARFGGRVVRDGQECVRLVDNIG